MRCVLCGLAFLLGVPTYAADLYKVDWVQQLPLYYDEGIGNLVADGEGGVFFSGGSVGQIIRSFAGSYDTSGNLAWLVHPGILGGDGAVIHSIAVDRAGNLYSFGDDFSAPTRTFITKHDPQGTLAWTSLSELEWETINNEVPHALGVDDIGNVFVAGNEQGEFVSMYNADGEWQWSNRRLPEELGQITGIVPDGRGDAQLLGARSAGPGLTALTFGSIDNAGNAEWNSSVTLALGNGHRRLAIGPDGDIFSVGPSTAPGEVLRTAVVSRYSASGDIVWTQDLEGLSFVQFGNIAVDDSGTVFVVGTFDGDGVVKVLNPSGDLIWSNSFGTPKSEWFASIAFDELGNVFIGGVTTGSWGGPNASAEPGVYDYDAVILKLSAAVPEPSTPSLAAIGSLFALVVLRRSRRRPAAQSHRTLSAAR